MARTDPAAAARAAMPERYGRPSRSRRVLFVLGLVAVISVALWWLLDAALEGSTPDVAAGVVGFDVVSDRRTELTFEVRRAVETPVTCEVYAQARDKAIVGERTVELGTAPPGSERTTASIATERRATTALVRACYPSPFAP